MSNLDESRNSDLIVVGGGAAGLAASIAAAEQAKSDGRLRIAVLDGAKTIGAKILISGGGRCNVTHEVVTPTDFFGNRRIIKNVLAAFPVERTVGWFASMGVDLKREETGKLFPVTDTARTVLNALLRRCQDLGVAVYPDHRVTSIEVSGRSGSGFVLTCGRGRMRAKRVILATGGRSLPRSGSDGGGYGLAGRMGHSVTPTVPALVPLLLKDHAFHSTLSGLSQEVELTTIVNGDTIDVRTGSLLWTHFGISGPVVMDASRFWTRANEQGVEAQIYGNFLPGWTRERAREWFLDEVARGPRRSLVKMIASLVPDRFAELLCTYTDCEPRKAAAQLPRQNRERLLEALVKYRVPVLRDRGWNYAEVTAGGVPLEEINYRTMESKRTPGLYLIGEILDCDGRIGGFNFQWVWATGHLAGRAAGTALCSAGILPS